jgi:hypothetical protein
MYRFLLEREQQAYMRKEVFIFSSPPARSCDLSLDVSGERLPMSGLCVCVCVCVVFSKRTMMW